MRLYAPLAFAIVLLSACRSAPPYQGLGATALHEIAERAYAVGDHDGVVRVVDQLLVLFPDYERAPEVRLLLARSYFDEEDYILASAEYQRFLDRFPSHASAPDAALGMCRSSAALSPDIQRDQSYTEEAEVQCTNVAVDYPGTAAAEEASRIAREMHLKLAEKLHNIANYYYRRDYYDSAIIYWEMVENQYADNDWAPRALLGIMRAYQEIGYDDLVQETRQKIIDSYPDSEEARSLGDFVTGSTVEASPGGGR